MQKLFKIAAVSMSAAALVSPAYSNEPLNDRLPDLVSQGYAVGGSGLDTYETGSKLFYNVVTVLSKDGDVVQCLQTWDRYFQEQMHRCVRISPGA